MSSKDKDSKSFQEKVKEYFKRERSKNTQVFSTGRAEYQIPDEKIKDLGKDSHITRRLNTLRDLQTGISERKLETETIAKIWSAIEDLLTTDYSAEIRHVVFAFLQKLIKGQSDKLQLMRAKFFQFIKNHDNPEDTGQRLDVLNCLTSNGKEIVYFEEEVGPFLLNWFPDIMRAGKVLEYLSLIDTVIRYNAAYLSDEINSGFINHICLLCTRANRDTVMSCLRIMTTLVAYSNLSRESLPKFIGALCRTVICESYAHESWKTMKNLLGTHMGHYALYTMCRILQEPSLQCDVDLLRGAVFYIHMALWGDQKLINLHCPPSSVLPSILQAVKSNQPTVAYECVQGIYRLVNQFGYELFDPSWSMILEILSCTCKLTATAPSHVSRLLTEEVHTTINVIEYLIDTDKYTGSIGQFYCLIEECAEQRPESSVLKLITYMADRICPPEDHWLDNLDLMMARYFLPNVRTKIRLKVLDSLTNIIQLYCSEYKEEVIDKIILPHMAHIADDSDVNVRTSVAELMIELCMDYESNKCLDMLNILDKLLLRPFNLEGSEVDFTDTVTLVKGLIRLFMNKIYKLPSAIPIKIYDVLVEFLVMHYSKPKIFANSNQCRYMVFHCFLKMRADEHYLLGCPDTNGKYRFSKYLRVWYPNYLYEPPSASPAHSPPFINDDSNCTTTNVSLKPAFKTFITCLRYEKDWKVLGLVLTEMPKALQNKSIILSKQGNPDLYLLVDALCNMISDKTMNLPDSLTVKVNKSDFQAAVLAALVSLASYHSCLEPTHQQKMIRCLMRCIQTVPRGSNPCIAALTICTLEMREAMVKMLPEVLLNMSKISATIYIAIPVLEFLSILTQLPMVFANFVADQYMAVFAIALPYTNPFKYNHYTVSLAHHVIAVWFLKCRLPFRKEFVRFITNGLQTNVLVPFEETQPLLKSELSALNEDSSDRKRSASLTEQGSRRRTQTMPSNKGASGAAGSTAAFHHRPTPIDRSDKMLVQFYEELTETCLDLMARYAFSPCSALPRRLPTAEFLLNGGQSMTWLVGNKLVTVTTSGCSQKVLKHGMCDKCWTLCREHSKLCEQRSGDNGQESGWMARQNSNDKGAALNSPVADDSKRLSDGGRSDVLTSQLQQLVGNDGIVEKPICACWCQGWAEVYVRRPTGDMSWVMRIQNQISFQQSMYDFPLNEMSTVFMPSLSLDSPSASLPRQGTSEEEEEQQPQPRDNIPVSNPITVPDSPSKQAPSRQNSRDSIDEDDEYVYDDGTRTRNPVRRSNSSPEMSANWKNPFMQPSDDNKAGDEDTVKKNKMYSKDMRVSCEAIPEEMGGTGTTPPSNDPLRPPQQATTHHPSLLSSYSYPGSSPPKEPLEPKPYQTVPPSPNINTIQPDFQRMAIKTYKSTSSGSLSSEKSGERPSNLPNLGGLNLAPLSGKPPQSPTQTSPRPVRHPIRSEDHEIQKSASSSVLEKNSLAKDRKGVGTSITDQAIKRDRTHTISVMSPANRKPRTEQIRPNITRTKEPPKNGINPSFVFLQLYHSAYFGTKTSERPLLVGTGDMVQRAVRILDSIQPYETHNIGVLYVKEDQVNSEVEILKNRFGSLRYLQFLKNLGSLIKLSDVDSQVVYIGGLEQNGNDGQFAYIWQDDVIRVTFHVTTMMPNKETDPNCNNKKLHIGNNFVTIIYNESGEEYNINTIKSQFNFAAIIIQPLDHNTNKVTVKVKDELKDLISISETKLVSDQNVAILARQLALHCNLASRVVTSLKQQHNTPYASNWLERLRKIKNVRTKVLVDPTEPPSTSASKKQMEDFTDYT